MIESPLLLEYRREILQEAILRGLWTKFGSLPSSIEARIQAVQDAERLYALVAQVAVSPDLGTFLVHLPASE
jgi:hypothetical protein